MFGSDAELVDVALSYLEEGLRTGDLTVLSCTQETEELLRRELGAGARGLESDPGLIPQDTRPPDVFTHLRQYAHRATQGGTSRLRVLAEVPAARDPLQVREVIRVEAAVNSVMADLPVTNLCVYDSRRLSPDLVASARDTHPVLATGATWAANEAYSDPASYIRALPSPRPSEESLAPIVVVDDAPSLPDLRHRLIGALPALVRDEVQLEDLRLGISEVAANAFRHGKRPVSGRLWSVGREVICTITDSGTTFDNPLAGFIPAHGFDLGRGGMGLWLARKLFDHVDLFPGPTGFTVRLSTTLR
ncbi:anti-sigma regulatory factor (Ser/Thr protein kinase) [Geodermatophilus daqingensis]|uniref:Anti-sigma regulatory factor (Ser/Thr protein kinase) n=1 Tax=Petropleomorpha daqingensis TaxID=2026353 RepID=A0A853CCQ2_9ACTN|nr:anti-sigma regulatory factor (Ser/Thr protein kinase) [Petropleomorpha daqingensis]